MLLTPTEMERLTIYVAAELARKHKAKGLPLNHPEAVAFIVDEILEGAREGRSVADLIAWGSDGLRAWRNRGSAGFHDATQELGLDVLQTTAVSGLVMADFDQDGDIDLIASTGTAGLRFLRNDGVNANELLKLRLLGNRSNASALGVKVELASGGWRTLRTVQQLPVEIGVGKRKQLDLVSTRWFDTIQRWVPIPSEAAADLIDALGAIAAVRGR